MNTQNTNGLNTRVSLVHLHIKRWTARKLDKRASADTNAREGAQADASRTTKNLLAGQDPALKSIGTLEAAARATHYALTSPWQQDGGAALASPLYERYCAEMNEHAEKFNAAVRDFIENQYTHDREQLMTAARFALGAMFDESDFPRPAALYRKFEFDFELSPLPTAGDFRAELSDDAVTAIRADIEGRNATRLQAAMADAWRKVYTPVAKMAATLPAYGGEVKRFNDSLVDNIRAIVSILPGLNLTNDPNLSALTAEIERKLCATDAQTLRVSDTARAQTADAAADIMKRMGGFMGMPAAPVPAPAPTIAPVIDLFTATKAA